MDNGQRLSIRHLAILPQRIIILTLFLFSLIVSFIFLLFFRNIGPLEHRIPGSDYFDRYTPITQSILNGKGIGIQKNSPVTGTPGYPFFLVPLLGISHFFGVDELSLIVFFNVLLSACASSLLFLLIGATFSREIGVIASLLWSSYPLNLWFIKNPNTEVPFMVILLLSLVFYLMAVRQKSALPACVAGVLLGVAILIRPIALFLPFLLFLFFFFTVSKLRRAFQKSLVFLLGTALILVPWISYASVKSGRFVPVSSLGSPAAFIGLTFAFVGNEQNQLAVPEDVRALMQRIGDAHPLSSKAIISLLFQEVRTHPISLGKLLVLKLLRAWYATYGMWWEKELFLLQLPYLLTAGMGIYLSLKRPPSFPLGRSLLLMVVFYFWALTFLGISIVRYMVPAMAFLMGFSALFIKNALIKFKLLL
ncbi:MAG: glycosyltransferase family 39 protein [Candidatus Portnoybacteria bacterium]|nr:glycosyltransferase family 39 protein [Candidatus Portnoybacteria bacterium]